MEFESVNELVASVSSRLRNRDESFTKLQIDDIHYPFGDLDQRDLWTSDKVSILLRAAAGSPFLDSLELRFVTFDGQVSAAFQELLLSSPSSGESARCRIWKSISITACSGFSSDDYHVISSILADSCQNFAWTKNDTPPSGMASFGLGLDLMKSKPADHHGRSFGGLHSLVIQRETLSSGNCKLLLHGLSSNTSIKRLALTFCKFDEEGCRDFAEILAQNSALQTLDLGACYLTDRQLATILFALGGHPSLKKFILTLNSCHKLASQTLGKLLEGDHIPNLEDLNLSHQKTDSGSISIEPLAIALRANSSLKILDLSRNNVDDNGFRELSNALEHNMSLRVLNLSSNDIEDSNEIVAASLPQFKRLQELYLRNNRIPDTSASGILRSLQGSRTILNVLNIRDSFPLLPSIRYELALNSAGRYLIRHESTLPLAVWANVLAKASRKVDLGHAHALDGLRDVLLGPAILTNR